MSLQWRGCAQIIIYDRSHKCHYNEGVVHRIIIYDRSHKCHYNEGVVHK